MQNFFITGTDTNVGKTHISCALLRDLRQRGIPALGYKPLACGDRADARAMRDATESSLSLDTINPIYLRTATAPYIAAELEQVEIKIEHLMACYHELCKSNAPIIVEGAGGWEVPLAPGLSISDLAVALNLPIILVVGNRLGAVNHTLLTLQAIAARGLECKGIILNHMSEEWDTASLTNRQLIERYTDVPVLAELICGQDDLDSSILERL